MSRSRILHHVGIKDFKRVRQRQIGEQKERAAKELKEWQEVEEQKKKREEELKQFKSDWRSTLTEDEWYAISGSGPTNSVSQTFAYADPGSGIETTVSGIGGADVLPATVTIDGETYDAPTYNQLALQGYTPLIQMQRRVSKLNDINYLLDAAQKYVQKIGADYMMGARVTSTEPQKPYMDAYFEVKGKWDKIIDELQYELQTKYVGQMAPKDLVDKINSLIVQRDAELDALSKKYDSIEPEASQVAGPLDKILDQVANKFKVGTAKNFLDYYINNFVAGDKKQNRNLTKLLSKNDYQYLQRMLSSALTGAKIEDPQGTLDGIMSDAPLGIRNSLGNGTKIDVQYYKDTGDFKLTKDYVFTEYGDFGGRADGNILSNLMSIGTLSYTQLSTLSALGPKTNLDPLINNPMRYHVIIKNKKKRQNESTTWERIQKYR